MAFHVFARRLLWSLWLFMLLFMGIANRAQAGVVQFRAPQQAEQCTTTCYVDAVTGDDANAGATPATALRTIQTAVERVQPGGEVRLAPGVYAERVARQRRGGDVAARPRHHAARGESGVSDRHSCGRRGRR